MSIERHGLSIGLERSGSDFYLRLSACGKLTHDDYKQITPMLDSALEGVDHPKIKALFDTRELEGWESRAAWDDFKLGLKHGREFEKIAVVGHKRWQEMGTKLCGWFISGDAKFFEDIESAYAWLGV